jgi:hypothetical protein
LLHQSDSVEGSSNNQEVFSDPEFLNSLKEPGIPPHELFLKIGTICRLTRNFDASRGLTKNTQVIVRKLLWHTVEVETISSLVAGKVVDPVGDARIPSFSYSTETRYDFIFHASMAIFKVDHGAELDQRVLSQEPVRTGCEGVRINGHNPR